MLFWDFDCAFVQNKVISHQLGSRPRDLLCVSFSPYGKENDCSQRPQYNYEKYKAEGRENPKKMTSMVLGHNRDTVTPVYLADLPPGRQKKK